MLKKLQSQVISIVLISGIALALAGSAYYWGLPLLEKTQKNVELESANQFMENLAKAIEEVAVTGNSKVIEYDLKGELRINNGDPLSFENYIEYRVEAPLPYYATLSYVPLNDYPPYKKRVYVMTTAKPMIVVEECNKPLATCQATMDCTNKKVSFDIGCEVSGDKYEGDKIVCSKDTFTVNTYTCDEYDFAYLEGSKKYAYAGVEGKNKPVVIMVRTYPYPTKEKYLNSYMLIPREIDNPTTYDGVLYKIIGKGKIVAKNEKVKILISRGESTIKPGESQRGGDLSIINIEVTVQ